jgi:hypothetical protein
MAVYDSEQKADTDSRLDLDSLGSDKLSDLEQKYSSSQDEAEDRAIETGADPNSLPNLGMGRRLREHGEGQEAEELEGLKDKLGYDPFSKEGLESKDFYNSAKDGSKPRARSRFASLTSKKVVYGGVGAGLASVLLVIGGLLGFLNVFKLDHIMQNIETKAFSRYQVAMDGRSDKWIKSYILLRLSEIEAKDSDVSKRENLIFRSDKVDTNNPIRDWYSSMRTSSFEQDLLEKYNIKFASVAEKNSSGGTTFKAAKVVYSDKEIPFNLTSKEIGAIQKGDINSLNGRLRDFVDVEVFDNHKDARKAIKTAVNENTKSWQVVKRRTVRKNIQNMTGVRSWRFFDKTRTKVEENVISVRNKIIKTALPDSTKTGKFVQCLFGITSCRASRDAIDPEVRSSVATTTGELNEGGNDQKPVDPDKPNGPTTNVGDDIAEGAVKESADAAVKEGAEFSMFGIKAGLMKTLLSKLSLATGILSALDAIARIDAMFHSLALVKMVTVARGTQAAGLYQTYMTARDQMKTGEATGEEIGNFMDTIGSVSNSEGWVKVIDPSSNDVKAEESQFTTQSNRTGYCSEEHQADVENYANHNQAELEFAYLCPDKQIGGTNSAAAITDWYNKGIGAQIGPAMSVYRHSPFSAISKLIGSVSEKIMGIFQPIINKILSAFKVDDAIGWLLGRLASALGAGPMMSSTEPSGVYGNVLVEGAAYVAESSTRSQGGRLTQPEDKTAAIQNYIAYSEDTANSQGVFQRYLSLSNTDSAASKTLFASIQNSNVNNLTSLFGQYIKNAARAPLAFFSRSAKAADEDIYAATNFAGIESYDFPTQCYNLDPLTMTTSQVTNANKIFAEAGVSQFTQAELTWDLVNNNTNFYDAVYQKLRTKYPDTADDWAVKIYDCAALDTAVRGGLGAVYGYTKDNGLEDGEATALSGGVGISADGFAFPIRATQQQVKEGLNGHAWCYKNTTNCHHHYNAADIFMPVGTPVLAPRSGTVRSVKEHVSSTETTVGTRITIIGDDGVYYYMAHMLAGSSKVVAGQKVTAGQEIGQIGDSEDAMKTTPHLHIDATPNGRPSCAGAACMGHPFIMIQPALIASFNNLPP